MSQRLAVSCSENLEKACSENYWDDGGSQQVDGAVEPMNYYNNERGCNDPLTILG